ncbi:MAG TPA: hypothetical protein VG477_11895 [Thermoanaerobaculia bacterium]|nr:hypothetical protein [Thermoanaerobaculia bacterium]
MALEDLQRNLAASLAGGRRAPDGVDPKALERTRAALESKRRQAARRLLPRLHAALGPDWSRRFHQHAGIYSPAGMRHHVDDAWAFARRSCARAILAWPAPPATTCSLCGFTGCETGRRKPDASASGGGRWRG